MPLIRTHETARRTVSSYADGVLRLGDVRTTAPVLVWGDRVEPWARGDDAAMDPASFALLWEAEAAVELLLIGKGTTSAPAPRALREALREHGIVVEQMALGPACRTFNLLVAEGRAVAAALDPQG